MLDYPWDGIQRNLKWSLTALPQCKYTCLSFGKLMKKYLKQILKVLYWIIVKNKSKIKLTYLTYILGLIIQHLLKGKNSQWVRWSSLYLSKKEAGAQWSIALRNQMCIDRLC